MRPTMFTRLLLTVMIVIALVGGVESGRSDAWDVAVIFAALVLMLVVLLARTSVARPLVPVRADLVRWLGRRAAGTGERAENLADRAISAYRDGLVGAEDPTGDQRDR